MKLNTVVAIMISVLSLATFTSEANAEFVCKPYPQYNIVGQGKVPFDLESNKVADLVETVKEGTPRFNQITSELTSKMGPAPWPIDEFDIWVSKNNSNVILVFLYKGCVLNMTLVPPELRDVIVGKSL